MMAADRVLLLFCLACAGCCARAPHRLDSDSDDGLPRVRHMIDTHIHLYDPRRPDGVPWPPPDDEVLYKPHLPDEFKRVSRSSGLTGVVIVEASERLADNRWVLDLVDGDDYFVALVGNIDPYRDDFDARLQELRRDKRFVGVRARNPEPIDYTNTKVLESFRALATSGLSLDFLASGQGVQDVENVDRLARAVPDLRIIVDHVIGYAIDGKEPDPDWVRAVDRLAQNPNVYCKISGLYQRCVEQPAPHDDAHYRSVLDVIWRSFGERRLIYGSNWPCTKKSGDYTSFVRLVSSYFADKGQEAVERYFWKNANDAYRLDLGS